MIDKEKLRKEIKHVFWVTKDLQKTNAYYRLRL